MNFSIESPESVGFSSERLARIRPAMQHFVDQRGFAGISTLIARRGKVVHFEQVGWQDREDKIPLAPDTIYRIYSMTKPIVCTAFMTLFEEGRFQLIDPVAKFIPAFAKLKVLERADGGHREAPLARPVTVRDLLTHTSGLTYGFLEDTPASEQYRQVELLADNDRTLEELTAELARLPLAYQPGTKWHYSVSIDVVAHLIEIISGMPLKDFLRARLFEPLGMTDTGFSVPPEKRARISAMYGHPDITKHSISQMAAAWMRGDNTRRDVDATYPHDNTDTFARGGHGLFSTVTDYARFAQMLLNGGQLDGARVLGPRIVKFMHSNHVSPALLPYEIGGVYTFGYGFGLGSRVLLNTAESGVPCAVGTFGWGGAATTDFWVDPHEEIIGVLMAQNMMSFDVSQSALRVVAYQALVD